jgi:hypothetical protein
MPRVENKEYRKLQIPYKGKPIRVTADYQQKD